jgi:predicted aspartyl protease
MRFEIKDDLLYLPITIFYDREITFTGIIDTGSAGTVVEVDDVSIDFLSRNARPIRMVGVGGIQEGFAQTLSSVSLGEFSVKDFEVEFCNLKDDFGFDAIIGSNLLKALGAVIDYTTCEITFKR